VLVIAPWNYPIHLVLLPMAGALAAGNAVVGKPSDVSAASSAALARWIPQYLARDAIAVVEGGADVTSSLLDERWDHVFYTGNARVGRLVMEAAARHLTPVTLELGGKSPAIVDKGADIGVAARRVVWGRFLNAGQTCVSPDYVLVDRRVEEQFVSAAARAVQAFYGTRPQSSPDYARIVSERHWDRLHGLLASTRPGQVVIGGAGDRDDLYLAPTILRDVGWEDPVMGEEIFGPILPVLPVDGVDEAIEAVTSHDKPLALYVFTEDQSVVDRVVAETSSGGVGVNVSLLQFVVQALPFGGVGASGMGAYHGKAGFVTFSHRKAVFQRPTRLDPPVTYPPYTKLKQRVLRKVF
jgi:aldehyde dehydrogenase (NAD+)